MNDNVSSNYSTLPVGQPHPNAALKKLPATVRDRVATVPMPVEYEAACKALAACESIDEGKYWSDKADALAAWAKIYKSDEAAVAARRLKLMAFRRMGELASAMEAERVESERARLEAERALRIGEIDAQIAASDGPERRRLQTKRSGLARGKISGAGKGAFRPRTIGVLTDIGVPKQKAIMAAQVAKLPLPTFQKAVDEARGLSATAFQARHTSAAANRSSDCWAWLLRNINGVSGPKLTLVRSCFRSRSPREVAAGIATSEVQSARELAIELIEWLDAFEQALPKDQK